MSDQTDLFKIPVCDLTLEQIKQIQPQLARRVRLVEAAPLMFKALEHAEQYLSRDELDIDERLLLKAVRGALKAARGPKNSDK